MITWNREEIVWAAGLLEGEGSFHNPTNGQIQISCYSSDRDVLEKLLKIFQLGAIYNQTMYPDSMSKKQMFVWKVGQRADVLAILFAIFPFMGERRKQKIKEIVANYQLPKVVYQRNRRRGFTRSKNLTKPQANMV